MPTTGAPSRRPRARAFTLIELLIVIGVLVILIALTITIGTKITASGRARAAADTIRVLDGSVSEWSAQTGDPAPSKVLAPEAGGGDPIEQPIIDGRPEGADPDEPALPSVEMYTAAILQEGGLESVFSGVTSSWIAAATVPTDASNGALPAYRLVDPWGNPLRYVHPVYDAGWGPYWDGNSLTSRPTLSPLDATEDAYQRSWRPFDPNDTQRTSAWVGDADEGVCVGNSPYFYSAGPDGDPGTIEDNVYSSVPDFPVDTARVR